MPIMESTEAGARKVLPIIYILDVSGSMIGQPIGALNQAMSETMPILREIEANNTGAKIKVGAMTFASNVQWVSNGLEDIEDFFWNDVKAGGLTELGAALGELNTQMSRHAMFQSDTGFKLPVLIFLSDGVPTDNWEKALAEIRNENKWFINSTKIAIALGSQADRDVLTKVADNKPEAVIAVDDLEMLKNLIKVVSATASKIGSVSKVSPGAGDAGAIVYTATGNLGITPSPSNLTPVPAPIPLVTDPDSGSAGGWSDDDWN